jgi:AcrR family transcriptional regulator
MSRKQVFRAEETKKAILSVAGKLFAEQGFHAVTMREIAKKAGCSHTTIYIYFTDKETLLYQLSMPPLKELQHLDHVGAIKGNYTDRSLCLLRPRQRIFYSAACSKRMEKLIKAKGCFPLAFRLSITGL